jgi:hypothetical protein
MNLVTFMSVLISARAPAHLPHTSACRLRAVSRPFRGIPDYTLPCPAALLHTCILTFLLQTLFRLTPKLSTLWTQAGLHMSSRKRAMIRVPPHARARAGAPILIHTVCRKRLTPLTTQVRL